MQIFSFQPTEFVCDRVFEKAGNDEQINTDTCVRDGITFHMNLPILKITWTDS